jgi:tetratricopeptide (TPR) repeat protein
VIKKTAKTQMDQKESTISLTTSETAETGSQAELVKTEANANVDSQNAPRLLDESAGAAPVASSIEHFFETRSSDLSTNQPPKSKKSAKFAIFIFVIALVGVAVLATCGWITDGEEPNRVKQAKILDQFQPAEFAPGLVSQVTVLEKQFGRNSREAAFGMLIAGRCCKIAPHMEEQAKSLLKRAISIYTSQPIVDFEAIEAINSLADVYQLNGDYARAIELNKQALTCTWLNNPEVWRAKAEVHRNLAYMYTEQHDTKLATYHINEWLNTSKRIGVSERNGINDVRKQGAEMLEKLNVPEAAEPLRREAVSVAETSYNKIARKIELATTLRMERKFRESAEVLESMATGSSTAKGNVYPPPIYLELAKNEIAQNHISAAENYVNAGIGQCASKADPDYLQLRLYLAHMYFDLGESAKAISSFRDATINRALWLTQPEPATDDNVLQNQMQLLFKSHDDQGIFGLFVSPPKGPY